MNLSKAEFNYLANNFTFKGGIEHNVHIDTPVLSKVEAKLLGKGFLKKRMDYNVRAGYSPRYLLTTTDKAEKHLMNKLGIPLTKTVWGHTYETISPKKRMKA